MTGSCILIGSGRTKRRGFGGSGISSSTDPTPTNTALIITTTSLLLMLVDFPCNPHVHSVPSARFLKIFPKLNYSFLRLFILSINTHFISVGL